MCSHKACFNCGPQEKGHLKENFSQRPEINIQDHCSLLVQIRPGTREQISTAYSLWINELHPATICGQMFARAWLLTIPMSCSSSV